MLILLIGSNITKKPLKFTNGGYSHEIAFLQSYICERIFMRVGYHVSLNDGFSYFCESFWL